MQARLAHRGPDGIAAWVSGPVALGFQAMHTTPEAARERQPFVAGGRAIVFHGRLDNREELGRDLGAREEGDAALALRACAEWGDEAAGRLAGDFAFACWDEGKRRLVCARDWIGERPFAYAVIGRRLIFASEPGALFADPELRREPNEGMIGEFLANAVTHREETMWRGVLRLPPSHLLVADAAGVRIRPYSPHRRGGAVRLGSDEEYGKRFRGLFRESVLCRMRSPAPVAADLSGGLDSSSIVGMASALHKEGLAPSRGFETFSQVFPGRPCDERKWIDAVVKKWGVTANFIETGVVAPAVFGATAARTLDFPGYPNSGVAAPMRPAARGRGFRVVLSGAGSDEWLTGESPRRGGLFRAGVKAVLPRPVFEAAARLMGKRKAPPWMGAEFARRVSLADRTRAKDTLRSPVEGAAAARRFAQNFSGWEQHMLEMDERDAAFLGLELRRPFLDRRLVEFGLGVPREQLRRGTVTKFVLRHGLRDLLPDAVRERTGKADFSHLFAEAFRVMGGASAFGALRIAARGWVDGKAAAKIHESVVADETAGRLERSREMWPLWMMCGVEIWYSQVFGDQGTPRP